MKIFSTLTSRKEEFVPADGKTVRMYVCGITPYAPAHVGHAMSYITFDAVRRYLEHKGWQVKHVQNFTDIDDKIIDRASRTNVDPSSLAEQHIEEFYREMDSLNIKRATVYPRATQELPQIIAMIEGLIEKEYAYASKGDVYYRVRKKQGYGSLSKRTLEGMQAGARVEVGVQKEHPMDFALWKGAKPGEQSWPSPWGPGRPGWHIECSAMSLHHLGEQLDIHGGGQDLIFPHHENEIAQSEAYTGKSPFSRIWMHNGLLQLGEEKMSKSLGNLVTVKEALEKFSADALRLFILGNHYRNPLKFSTEAVEAADKGAARLRGAGRADLKSAPTEDGKGASPSLATPGVPLQETWRGVDAAPFKQRFVEAMDDDFNTPQAIAALFDLSREINGAAAEGGEVAQAQATLRELAGVLGLTLEEKKAAQSDAAPFIELLIELRGELRKAKRFDLADKVRDRLTSQGVSLEDTAQGTRWRMGR
ncbi:MAG: cysteine--tRNA ligase [Chloroflexi bacterium]|nr:cysteine--tRNA ligase [Chloroflexota bacterium]